MDNFDVRKFITEKRLYEQEDVIDPEEVPGEDEDFSDPNYNPQETIDFVKSEIASKLRQNRSNVNKDVLNMSILAKSIKTLLSSDGFFKEMENEQFDEDAYEDVVEAIPDTYFFKYILPQGYTSEDQIVPILEEFEKLFEVKLTLPRVIKFYKYQVGAFKKGQYDNLVWSDSSNRLVPKKSK